MLACARRSYPIRKHVDEELFCPLPQRTPLPLVELDRARGLLIALEYLLHSCGSVAADHYGVDLVVVQEAARVEISGADDGDGAVDDDALGMEQGVFQLVDLHSRLQQASECRLRGVEHNARIRE